MKVGIDTNILLRLIIQDDPLRVEKAATALKKYKQDGDIFISNLVFLELFWVLRSPKIGLSKDEIFTEFELILLNKNFCFENEALIRFAIAKGKQNIDFDDAVIGLNGYFRKIKILTFDEGLVRDTNFIVLN